LSPNGDEILFFSNRDGLYDLWLIHPDGSALRQLTAVTTAGHEMQGSAWIDRGSRILASRQGGGPSLLDPAAGLRQTDPRGLPGFCRRTREFLLSRPLRQRGLARMGRWELDRSLFPGGRQTPAAGHCRGPSDLGSRQQPAITETIRNANLWMGQMNTR